MLKPLNTLILEDSEIDALLLLRELRRGDFDVHHLRVYTEAAFRDALRQQQWDIILSDYNIPGFDPLVALQILREEEIDLPFILISGYMDEDAAVTAMKAGASDIFSKDKLARLVPAVERELREAAGRRKRREAEAGFTKAFHASPVGTVISRVSDGVAIDVNARFLDNFGYTREQVIGISGTKLGFWASSAQREQFMEKLYKAGSLSNVEMEVCKSNGEIAYTLVSAEVLNINGERCILAMFHDITERKEWEKALKRYTQRLELLHEIDRSILRADQPQTIAQSVLHRLQPLMAYHSASVTTFDHDYRTFTVLATNPVDFSILIPGKPRRVENRAMLESLKSNEIYNVKEFSVDAQSSTTERALYDAGIRSFVRIPLVANGILLGTMNFHADKTDAFDHKTLNIASEAAAQMAIAIHNAQLYLQVQNHAQELEQRVLERTLELQASEENLRAALAQEKELSELKTRFVSMVSHDFRTPLTIIQSNANLLEASHGRLDQEKQQRYFSRIYTQIQRMVHLLEDVLTFSRSEAGTSVVNLAPLDLGHFCRDIVEEFRSTNDLKHSLVYHCADGAKKITADEKLLQQAVINLLTNAIKYSPEGSAIQLDVGYEERHAVIQIRDQGIGIPKADQTRLFEMFHRASNVGTIEGTGLGLAIVKRSVEAHNGMVEFESEEGKGTTFRIKIPKKIPGA